MQHEKSTGMDEITSKLLKKVEGYCLPRIKYLKIGRKNAL